MTSGFILLGVVLTVCGAFLWLAFADSRSTAAKEDDEWFLR